MEDLPQIYKHITWPMKPHDEMAHKRSAIIIDLFKKLFKQHTAFKSLQNKNKLRILELGCGTGIAGASISKAISEFGYEVDITFTDIREDDLQYVDEWIKILGLSGISYKSAVADAKEIDRYVKGRYDLIIFWGSSMPHFDVFEFALMASSIHRIASEEAIFMLEQANLGWKIMATRSFERLVIEGRLDESGGGLISIFSGYDPIKGVQYRHYYLLPEYRHVGMMKSRLWDIASLLGILWIFFQNVDAVEHLELRDTFVLLAWNKRETPGLNLKI